MSLCARISRSGHPILQETHQPLLDGIYFAVDSTHPQIPVAFTWSKTSPWPGSGTGASTSFRRWSAVACKEGLGRGVLTKLWPFADAAAPASCCIFADISSEFPLVIVAGAILSYFLQKLELKHVSKIGYTATVHDFAACVLQLI